LLQQLGKGLHGIGQGLLPFGRRSLVAPDVGMPGVLPREQRGPRWGTHGGARVKLGEAHAFGRKTVQMGGADVLLPIYTKVAVTKVIRKDEHDVWPFLCM